MRSSLLNLIFYLLAYLSLKEPNGKGFEALELKFVNSRLIWLEIADANMGIKSINRQKL